MFSLSWRLAVVALAASAIFAVAPQTGSGDPQPVPTAATPQSTTTVAPKRVHRHRRLLIVTRFVPWATPTPAQVLRIVAIEAQRWRVSAAALDHRIYCESTMRWSAQNGQYEGLGQFAEETFRRGMSSIHTRRVVLESRRWRWSSRHFHQLVVHRRVGMIPSYPPRTHGWAQVRLMARAAAGLGAVKSSEWSCPL